MSEDNPLIVGRDRTVLLETDHPLYETARQALAAFADLVKSPEGLHTYKITPLTLWNAAASGHTASDVVATLSRLAKFPIPEKVEAEILELMGRYGRVRMLSLASGDLLIESDQPEDLLTLLEAGDIAELVQRAETGLRVPPEYRGLIKQRALRLGWPIVDLAGYVPGAPLPVALRPLTASGRPFAPRHYQQEAALTFHAGGSEYGGCGVVVLPCGAGKTVVGITVMELLQTQTLILTSNVTSVRQWVNEIIDKTTLCPGQVTEYTGQHKGLADVTVSTYQLLTHRGTPDDEFPHLSLFRQRDWGLIIYDEVHLLPAPVFRITADIQARRRLGLTATLVREDGREEDVFSLVGPKRYELPWKTLEAQGFIATAYCHELRVPMHPNWLPDYAAADTRGKTRLASENPAKLRYVRALLKRHARDSVLIIGQYIEQLKHMAEALSVPLITGSTPNDERDRLYQAFRTGELRCLLVSKVANFAIDLPDANVAIQVSGTYGSRQEEAQRLGRILRPKSDGSAAHFYTLVTQNSREQPFATKRQRFLAEQGYSYEVTYGDEWLV